MLFSPATHAMLLAVAILGTVVLGVVLARQKTWAALLLWAVPIAGALSAADLALAFLGGNWPHLAMDGGDGDVVLFGVVFVMVLIPIELLYQGIIGAVAGAGTVHREAAGADPGAAAPTAQKAPVGDDESDASP